MPINIIRGNETSRNLSRKEKQKLLLDAKNYETLSRTRGIVLPSYGQRIDVTDHSSEWPKRFDGSYQEAIAFIDQITFQVRTLEELKSVWGLLRIKSPHLAIAFKAIQIKPYREISTIARSFDSFLRREYLSCLSLG